jgi:TupA-like ATPgrasp
MAERLDISAHWALLLRRPLARTAAACWAKPGCKGLARRCLRAVARLDMQARFGRTPDHPDRLFNDFLYALKVGDALADPLRQRITDKAEVKAYIAACLGAGTTVPTLALLDTPDALAAFRPDAYPVAAKPTHSSGRLIRINSDQDWRAALPRMTGWLEHDYFRQTLEQNYAGLPKRVIVEPWLDKALSLEGSVHCRDGVPKVVSIIERHGKSRQSYTPDRKPLGVSLGFPLTAFALTEWSFFDPLLAAAARLSADLSYIRVDFYTDGRRLVFGELTNLPASGLGRFYPDGGEEIFSAAFFAPHPDP